MAQRLTMGERNMNADRIRAAALNAARSAARYEALCIYEETGMVEDIEANVNVDCDGRFVVVVKHTPREKPKKGKDNPMFECFGCGFPISMPTNKMGAISISSSAAVNCDANHYIHGLSACRERARHNACFSDIYEMGSQHEGIPRIR